MPTGAKLVAALFFAAFGYFAADIVKPFLVEGTQTHWMNETLAGIGFVMGWVVLGPRAGDGVIPSMGYGLTVVFLMAFWALVIFSMTEMLFKSIDKQYAGPMQALRSMIGMGVRDVQLIGNVEVIIAMLFGGAFGGWITEWASRRWS